MMKSLNVPLIDSRDLDTALEVSGARFYVDQVNWPAAFPYAPFCGGRVARTEDALVVDFRVSGLDLRVENLEDNGRQWEDSCVEVFIQDPFRADYYNFEINALGKVLACCGPTREGRVPRLDSEMQQILRFAQNDMGDSEELRSVATQGVWGIRPPVSRRLFDKGASLCHPEEPKATKDLRALNIPGLHSWRVGVVIPFSLIGIDPENLPHSIRANFFKCGDKTAHPHFLSWNPISTPSPDFHRPEFFGELVFQPF